MKSLALKVHRFLVSEDGPTAVEYAVMLALIIIVCLTAIKAVGTTANDRFTDVKNALTPAPYLLWSCLLLGDSPSCRAASPTGRFSLGGCCGRSLTMLRPVS